MTRTWDARAVYHAGVITNSKIYSIEHFGDGASVPRSRHGKGSVSYAFHAYDASTGQETKLKQVPSERILRNLAKKYLGSTYADFSKIERTGLCEHFPFYIRSGLPQEKLVTFLAAAVVKGLR